MTTPRIARKRELKTESVLDAATAVVEAEGLDGLTLGRVAEAMGLVPAALYRYFGSKDALLAGLQRRAIAQIGEVMAEALVDLPDSDAAQLAITRLIAVGQAYSRLPKRVPQAWHLVSTMLGNPRSLLSVDEAQGSAPALAGLLTTLRAGFEQAAHARVLSRGDAAGRTVAFWGALHGVQAVAKLKRYAPEFPAPEAVTVLAVDSLLLGWGCKPALLERAKKALGGRKT